MATDPSNVGIATRSTAARERPKRPGKRASRSRPTSPTIRPPIRPRIPERRRLPMAKERLQKILARAGVASRRGAERMIREGRVRINGRVVDELGVKADARSDRIDVDNRRIVVEKPAY